MKTPQISVVIPVYNVEKYLSKCVDSVLAQTFRNIEIILVDDGASDSSGSQCDLYAKKDDRIRVFHKKNGGVSSARNVGLDNALGEWITFVDSDDFISDTYLENLYAPITSSVCVDFIQAGCTNYIDDKLSTVEQKYNYYCDSEPMYVFNNFRGLSFSKLFCLDIINSSHLRFDEQMRTAEDMAFTLDYLLHINSYCFITEVGYYYRRHSESLTQRQFLCHYNTMLAEFKHIYYAISNYTEKFQLSRDVQLFRKSQVAERLFSAQRALYMNGMAFNQRIYHLKNDFTEEERKVLFHLRASFIKKQLAILYVKKRYYMFDLFMKIANGVISFFANVNRFIYSLVKVENNL